MNNNLKKLIAVIAAGGLLAPALQAQISLVTVGGNASIKLIQNRLPTILSGAVITVNPTNNLLFKATGTFNGQSVDWEFNLTGGAGAISDIANSTPVLLEDGTSTAVPQLAISATAPETVGIDSSPYQQDITIVVPVVFVKGSALGGVTNLTQRQASYLESSGYSLPATYFGGTNSDFVPYVGRNNLAAVRQLFDAGVYFTGSAANFTTNSNPPFTTPQPYVGASSGTEVAAIVGVLTNSIGTVAAQDIGSLPTLSYEGVPFTTANVVNGTYPLWGYERYIYVPGSLTTGQQNIVNALEAAVEAPSFQTSSSLFIGKFVSYSVLNAVNGRSLSLDGGPITSNVY
jgi:hypothetical protein